MKAYILRPRRDTAYYHTFCLLKEGRVTISGKAVKYVQGIIEIN